MARYSTRRFRILTLTVAALTFLAACGDDTVSTTTTEAPPTQSEASVTVSVDPTSGPTGTEGTITVTGEPNSPVTLEIGPTSTSGTTDANGRFTHSTTFSGRDGDKIDIKATVGNSADSPDGSATFSVTAPTVAEASASVTVDPTEGPTGTQGTITVTGEPNSPVTLEIGPTSTSNTTDADGKFTHTTTFSGQVDDVIDITATVGNSSDSPSGSATFTITGIDIVFEAHIGIGQDRPGHGPFIPMPDMMPMRFYYGSLNVEGEAPFVDVAGDLNSDGTFTATGQGTVAGFENIAVEMTGTVTPYGVEAEYSMGVEGGLPGGDFITYVISGTPVVDASQPIPDDAMSDVEAFYAAFNAAQVAEDPAAMLATLHPIVLVRYGEGQCNAYVTGIVNPTVVVTPLDVTAFGTWTWERDGATSDVADVLTVTVEILIDGESQGEQGVHLAYVDGELTWFTDCGDLAG